ncbi:MAG: FHA domain-containing protein [Planctomycetota bacterium]
MVFNVKIPSGPDEGRTFRVDGLCIVGRAPRCHAELSDPAVAWEHAALRDDSGRLFVRNLSAAGTKLNGRAVTAEARVVHGDEIELAVGTRLVVEESVGAKQSKSLVLPLVLILVLLCAVVGVAATQSLGTEPAPPRQVGFEDWQRTFNQIADRLDRWEARSEFPSEATVILRDAWRLEMASNAVAALDRYEALGSVLLTLQLPGEPERRTIAEAAGIEPETLNYMLREGIGYSGDPRRFETDEAFADALVWFARERAWSVRRKLENRR